MFPSWSNKTYIVQSSNTMGSDLFSKSHVDLRLALWLHWRSTWKTNCIRDHYAYEWRNGFLHWVCSCFSQMFSHFFLRHCETMPSVWYDPGGSHLAGCERYSHFVYKFLSLQYPIITAGHGLRQLVRFLGFLNPRPPSFILHTSHLLNKPGFFCLLVFLLSFPHSGLCQSLAKSLCCLFSKFS